MARNTRIEIIHQNFIRLVKSSEPLLHTNLSSVIICFNSMVPGTTINQIQSNFYETVMTHEIIELYYADITN